MGASGRVISPACLQLQSNKNHCTKRVQFAFSSSRRRSHEEHDEGRKSRSWFALQCSRLLISEHIKSAKAPPTRDAFVRRTEGEPENS